MDIHAVGKQTDPSSFLPNRLDRIKALCAGKSVLDVGCVDHDARGESTDTWLHKVIKGVARELVGVDFEAAEVDILKQRGYNIIVGNVETVALGKQYEVIVAGELIEHLSNPGLFLDNMHRHLEDTGIMIITTPNAYAFRYQVKHLFKGAVVPNPQHSAYFDYFTLKELCGRHGFSIRESYYFIDFEPSFLKSVITRLFIAVRKSFAPRIMLVLEKQH